MRLVCIDAPETSQYIEGCDQQTYSHLYIGSERSFYRVLHANSQLHRRGKAIEICRRRARVYELARIANPKRWSRSIRCWKQPDLVWINEPLEAQQTSLQVALAREA